MTSSHSTGCVRLGMFLRAKSRCYRGKDTLMMCTSRVNLSREIGKTSLGYNHVPCAVLQRQMSGISFLLCWHCLHKHPPVTKASWLAFGISGPRAQPCCLKNLERQPRGTEVCVLGPWVLKSLKPKGSTSTFNWYFGSLVKYLSEWSYTVLVEKRLAFRSVKTIWPFQRQWI